MMHQNVEEEENFSWINLDTKVSSYVRWESDSRAEIARIMAEWYEDLERVDAEIRPVGDCEISYTMTLRQCFEIGWEFDCYGPGEKYLAWNMDDERVWWEPYSEDPPKGAMDRISQLWEEYAARETP